jgi:protein-tyrosine phosphatase
MLSVAFICTANVCRSVMAHAILAAEIRRRNLPMRVYSAGIRDFKGAAPADNAWITCLQHNTPVPKMESTFAGHLELSAIDHFLVMEQMHAKTLISSHDIPENKIAMLSSYDPQKKAREITDPMNQGIVAFEECYGLIQKCIDKYLDSMGYSNPTPSV